MAVPRKEPNEIDDRASGVVSACHAGRTMVNTAPPAESFAA